MAILTKLAVGAIFIALVGSSAWIPCSDSLDWQLLQAVYLFGIPPQVKRKLQRGALQTMGENQASSMLKGFGLDMRANWWDCWLSNRSNRENPHHRPAWSWQAQAGIRPGDRLNQPEYIGSAGRRCSWWITPRYLWPLEQDLFEMVQEACKLQIEAVNEHGLEAIWWWGDATYLETMS